MMLSICFNYLVLWGQDVWKSNDCNETLKSTFGWINKQRIFQECQTLLLSPPSMRWAKSFQEKLACQTTEWVALVSLTCSVNGKWGQELDLGLRCTRVPKFMPAHFQQVQWDLCFYSISNAWLLLKHITNEIWRKTIQIMKAFGRRLGTFLELWQNSHEHRDILWTKQWSWSQSQKREVLQTKTNGRAFLILRIQG